MQFKMSQFWANVSCPMNTIISYHILIFSTQLQFTPKGLVVILTAEWCKCPDISKYYNIKVKWRLLTAKCCLFVCLHI